MASEIRDVRIAVAPHGPGLVENEQRVHRRERRLHLHFRGVIQRDRHIIEHAHAHLADAEVAVVLQGPHLDAADQDAVGAEQRVREVVEQRRRHRDAADGAGADVVLVSQLQA